MQAIRNDQRTPKLHDIILSNIAEFIADPKVFFAFLQAVVPANLHEPYKSIWELQELEINHSDLWPLLRITDKLSFSQLEKLQDCISHYPVVRVEGMGNVEWQQQHLPPTTEVHWTLPAKLPPSQWNELNSFQTSRVRMKLSRYDNDDVLVAVLSDFPHLKALDIRLFEFEGIESILSFAADNTQLTELELSSRFEYDDYLACLTETMVENIIKWFRRQPVRVFRVHHWGIDADDD
ncbi:unnamed protein product [Aphanomyces euteiches]|uniref:F-box domain-containing protein n=1 Tax=Aphanomyces euteiches TaxID=100861 RepID=A0A6G0WV88_9STRA|nr:hypothetical protein Ae201684_011328 [Aphanomyces euteiches]KAH9100954.1 hypothetical protein Ae201684P_007145 [Aphanomyces euteiches]KAH9151090.1 hypothetical protein AeRB84_006225 [Aphanomyces euteiches]